MGKMTSNRPNCSGLGLGILVALFCHQVSKADVTAEEIISRHRTSVEAIHTYHFESDNFNQSMNSKDQGKTVFQRSRMEIVADREHSRLKVYTSRTANPDEALVEEKSQIQLFVWDGKVNYEYRITPGEGTPESRGILFRTKDVAENDSHLRNMDSGVALDGVFKGNVESIKEILRRAKEIHLRDGTDSVGGAECYVIEAVADSGKYTLWFDPSHSYNIAKAEMRKGPTDLYMGKPLGERRDASGKLLGEQSTEYIFSMETLRFAQDGNIWVPAEASIMCEQNFSTGRTFSEKAHHVRNVVEINRVLDPAVFVAAFPDHTRAFDTDVASGIQWVWNQGKFSPDVDEEAVAAVEQTARQINTDPILANESSDGGSPFNFRSWALICAALVGALSLLIWQLRYRQSRIS